MIAEYLESIRWQEQKESGIYRCNVMFGVTAYRCRLASEGALRGCGVVQDHFEALLCQTGRIQVKLTDGRIETAGPGELLLLTYLVRAEELSFSLAPVSFLAVTVDKRQAQYSTGIQPPPFDSFPAIDRLRKLMEECGGCMALHDEGWSSSTLAALHELPLERQGAYFTLRLMERLCVLCCEPVSSERGSDTAPERAVVYRVHDYILENLDQTITIQQLSQKFSISPTRLKESFRQIYGKPIHTYLQHYRLQKAAQLLSTTTQSVLSIANQIGYSGTSRFNVAFKEMYHQTPMEYRRLYQK